MNNRTIKRYTDNIETKRNQLECILKNINECTYRSEIERLIDIENAGKLANEIIFYSKKLRIETAGMNNTQNQIK